MASFLSQQAAEKTLKALFIETKRKMPEFTHNLIDLGESLNLPEKLIVFLAELTPEYTITRYPDAANGIPAQIHRKSISDRHVKNAEEVVKWVEKKLKM